MRERKKNEGMDIWASSFGQFGGLQWREEQGEKEREGKYKKKKKEASKGRKSVLPLEGKSKEFCWRG